MKTLLPLALCLLLPSIAPAQEAVQDPFAPTPATPAPVVDQNPPVRLRLETWEAPALEVARKLDEVVTAKDLANLREQCLGGAPGVALVLSSAITSATPSKVSAESITERIYPTEYEPPELPGSFSGEPDKKDPAKIWPQIVNEALQNTTPTSFETRNTGLTLEAEITSIPDMDKTWSVRIAMDDVHHIGTDHFGVDLLKVEMPIFNSFRNTGELRLKEGEWQILSVMEPPRGLENKPSDKRWVTLVRLDALR
ncbi:hypothetical protein [Haloferula sp. BvORR071]|uniref:hypothetical protein n=1 Tax=Haloferula sp. BvORR071 TaxID=1396141 RepID=UPI0005508A5E|nr:hypothetical protein [Haloferula sp. BvORR071]